MNTREDLNNALLFLHTETSKECPCLPARVSTRAILLSGTVTLEAESE
jgi:hypothetical protein